MDVAALCRTVPGSRRRCKFGFLPRFFLPACFLGWNLASCNLYGTIALRKRKLDEDFPTRGSRSPRIFKKYRGGKDAEATLATRVETVEGGQANLL